MTADIIQSNIGNTMKPGTVVTLRSGGSNMLVVRTEGVNVHVVWANGDGSLGYNDFKRWALQIIQPCPEMLENGKWSNCK